MTTLIRITFICVCLVMLVASRTEAQTTTTYFPSSSMTDGRFLAIAGTGFNAISGDTISIGLISAAASSDLTFGIFDGETGGMWDQGTTPLTYRLYADPTGTGNGTTLVGSWNGSSMSDNAWYSIAVANVPAALGGNGQYHYVLKVASSNSSQQHLSAFKVRCLGGVELLRRHSFHLLAPMSQVSEAQVIYPNYPSMATTTFDGTFLLHLSLPLRDSTFTIWNGDLDFGNWAGDTLDSDDPDTPNSLPAFAISTTAVAEGVALGDTTDGVMRTGFPTDNSRYAMHRRGSSITFEVVTPWGASYRDPNPSGNLEWEQFKLSTAAFDRNQMDVHVDSLPAGMYDLLIVDADLGNFQTWRFDYDVLGVDSNGTPFDIDPPGIVVTPNVSSCWPPNHRMVNVTMSIVTTEEGGVAPTVVLESVTSNEPDNGVADGDTWNDIQNATTGTRDTAISLRCERAGRGSSRVYTMVYRATDAGGNIARDTAYFTVPHDSRKSATAVDVQSEGGSVSISQNHPNPFVRETDARYTVREDANVVVAIYTVDGRLVRALEQGRRVAGAYVAHWDGLDDAGNAVPAGVYFFHVRSEECGCGSMVQMVLTGGVER